MDLKIWPVLALLYGSSFWGIVWYPARLLEDQGIVGFWLVLSGYSVSLLIFSLFYGIRWRGLGERPWDVVWFMLATGWSNVGLLIPLINGEVVRVLILFYLSPLWAVILGAWLLNERINRLTAWMLLLGLGGAMITLWQDKVTYTSIDAMDWMALSAGFAFALNSVMARRLHHLSALHKNQLTLLGIMLMAGVCVLLLGEPIPQASQSAWLGAIALGVFGFMFAGLSIVYGVSHMPVQRSAVIMLFELIVGAISAWLLIDQAISGQVWLGGSMIVIAGLVAVFAAHQHDGEACISDPRQTTAKASEPLPADVKNM
jgi:drug/metabolite transporter (DMT)-like permease